METNGEEMSAEIAIMETISRDLSVITRVEDAKEYRDRAAAVTAYVRGRGESLEIINQAQEVRLRMERRAGELLAFQVQHGGDRKSSSRAASLILKDVGINHTQSSQFQRIAAIPADAFEGFLSEMKTKGLEITLSAALNVHREYTRSQRREEIENMETLEPTGGSIILGQMEEALTGLVAEGSVDLIVTDPPYGIGDTSEIQFKERANMGKPAGKWDKVEILEKFDLWLPLFKRVLKPTGSLYVFFDYWYISFLREKLIQHGFTPRNAMVWAKTNPPPSVRKRNFVQCTEDLYFATVGGQYTFNWLGDKEMRDTIENPICGGSERLDHPTQKPVAVLKKLIAVSSNPGDLVLDPFAGVGSTGAAAKELGRQYILVEANEFYYKQACTRLS